MNIIITIFKTFTAKIKAFFSETIIPKTKILFSRKHIEYNDLAPVTKIENGDEYLYALHWAIKNPKIKNIALTGPYGSGKSSVINSYLKMHPIIKHKAIRISMASFIQKESDEKNILSPDQIEQSILKQLFYKVEYSKIPHSRYRKIHKTNILKILGFLMAICCISLIIEYVFFPDFYFSTINQIKAAGSRFNLPANLTLCFFKLIAFVVLFIISYLYRSLLSKFKLRNIKLPKDTSIEEAKDSNETIFNKNMDEIVYFFEETKYRIVFFEDLDRLEQPSIFTHLREINTVLNNYDAIKKPIVFIYAVKDDIFAKNDRTKFFDFIIPIIPYINCTNSGDEFIKKKNKAKKSGVNHNISEEYILDVSPYIEEMRILHNIYNEFVIYKKTLCTDQDLPLTDERMMSLIIFKNLYPKDFADLQNETGIVKTAFDEKKQYLSQLYTEHAKKLNELIIALEKYNADAINDVNGLKYAMLGNLSEWKFPITNIGTSQSKKYSFEEIMKDDFDLTVLLTLQNCTIWYYRAYSGETSKSIDNFDEIIKYYCERFQYIKKVQEKGIDDIQKEIESLRRNINDISGWSMQQLLIKTDAKNVFTDDIKNNKLLVLMLRNGYINEEYPNYINYFKGNSITPRDMKFILSIKNREPFPFDYTLDKIPLILEKIKLHEFKEKSIYNFNLLEYLLTFDTDQMKLKEFLIQLSDGSVESWEFINSFIDKTEQPNLFVKELSSVNNNFWNGIYNNSLYSYNRKLFYLSLLINSLSNELLIKQNINNKITEFIQENKDILQKLSEISPDDLINTIKTLDVSFHELEIDGVSTEILDFIFDNKHYELNYTMVEQIVKHKNKNLISELSRSNYSTVMELGYKPLIEYIQENLNNYTETIVLAPKNVHEKQEFIIDLINRCIDNPELCVQIVEHEEFRIDNISNCCSNFTENKSEEVKIIWDELLNLNKTSINWENINSYWKLFSFTEVLINYIQLHTDILQEIDCDCIDDTFIESLILSDINEKSIKLLLPKMEMNNLDLDLSQINDQRVSTMIKCKFYTFNAENYSNLCKTHPNLCLDYIIYNQELYFNSIDDIPITETIFEKILSYPHLNPKLYRKLLETHGENIMNSNIAKLILDSGTPINIAIFRNVFLHLKENDKRSLMLKNLSILNAEDFELCFAELSNWYSDFIDRSSRRVVEIEYNDENMELAKRLEDTGYITSKEIRNSKENKKSSISCRIKAIK